MPGGGGLQSANWLFNVAPKDGLVIGLIQRGVPFYPYLRRQEREVRARPKFNWLGSFAAETGSTTIWHTAKAQTMADAFKDTVVLGGSGPNDSETYPHLMNNTIGTKFRVVSRLSRQLGGVSGDGARRGRRRHRLLVVGEVGAAELDARQAGAGAGAGRADPCARSARRSADHGLT